MLGMRRRGDGARQNKLGAGTGQRGGARGQLLSCLFFNWASRVSLWRWRATVCSAIFCAASLQLPDAICHHDLDRRDRRRGRRLYRHQLSGAPNQYWHTLRLLLVCFGVIILRRTDPTRPRPFKVPMMPIFPLLGVLFCVALMLSLPLRNVAALHCLARAWADHLFFLR